jgi:ABC-type multidrug transport system ATPase subunit
MKTLATMAHDGRTIISVTHTTLNLHLCDQVVFLGAGGKLCFAGKPQDALGFFGVTDFVDVYGKMEQDVIHWASQFKRWSASSVSSGNAFQPVAGEKQLRGTRSPSFFSQFATLAWRYAKLMANDRSSMALLLLQAPLLAILISIVAGSSCFAVFEDTKSCLFALSCAAFWVGILDAIQGLALADFLF